MHNVLPPFLQATLVKPTGLPKQRKRSHECSTRASWGEKGLADVIGGKRG